MHLDDLRHSFFSKIAPDLGSDCILWTAAKRDAGYGLLWVDGVLRSATHVSWLLKHGVWPTLHVLHTCDNPPCVNPGHLFEGTDADNMADRGAKGRTHQKLTGLEISEIVALTETRMGIEEIARLFDITPGYVSALRHGRFRTVSRGTRKPTSCATLVVGGETLTIAEAVARTGLTQNTLRRRMADGVTGDALVAPAHKAPRKPYVRRK